MDRTKTNLRAGGVALDITPDKSLFLRGYPHVERYSTGILDPLMASALYLTDGENEVIIIANDVIFVSKDTTERVRRRIGQETGVPAQAIQLSATHTHSGPMTAKSAAISTQAEALGGLDADYMAYWEGRMVEAAVKAKAGALWAEVGLVVASAKGLGTNRHDPKGPSDFELPVLGVRACDTGAWIACMTSCNIHPTVLHEDSTLYSGDFPGQAREILRDTLGAECPFIYHNGNSGNQSPRHVTRANTPAEARRLGGLLADAVRNALAGMKFETDLFISARQTTLELLPRRLPPLEAARALHEESIARLRALRESGAPRTEVRTAECDWFGAEKSVELARAEASGELDQKRALAQPAEIAAVLIGPWTFVFWPGEWFVEYGLAVKEQCPNTYIITCANGETQGYIVTEDAVQQKRYEATNAIFCHSNGPRGVAKTLELLH